MNPANTHSHAGTRSSASTPDPVSRFLLDPQGRVTPEFAELAGSAISQTTIGDLVLVRHGVHHVFESTSRGVVFRVHPREDRQTVEAHLDLITALSLAGAPVLSPLSTRAVTAGPVAATLWPRCTPIPSPGDRLLGNALRELHQTGVPASVPVVDVSERLDRRMVSLDPGIPAEVTDMLAAKVREAKTILADTLRDYPGTAVLLHGDAHPGNAMVHNGRVVFIDLDDLCRGPREFDLAPAAVSHARLHRNQSRWRAFRAGYGGGVDWGLVERLTVVRETTMNTWLAGKWGTGPDAQEELARRMATWDQRTGDPAPWLAF